MFSLTIQSRNIWQTSSGLSRPVLSYNRVGIIHSHGGQGEAESLKLLTIIQKSHFCWVLIIDQTFQFLRGHQMDWFEPYLFIASIRGVKNLRNNLTRSQLPLATDTGDGGGNWEWCLGAGAGLALRVTLEQHRDFSQGIHNLAQWFPSAPRIKSKLSRLPAFSSHCVTVFCLILQGLEALFYVKIIFVFSTILRKLQALFCLSELFLCFLLQVSSLLSCHFIFSISMSSSICVNVFSTKKPDVTFLDFHDLFDLSWLWPHYFLSQHFSYCLIKHLSQVGRTFIYTLTPFPVPMSVLLVTVGLWLAECWAGTLLQVDNCFSFSSLCKIYNLFISPKNTSHTSIIF